MEDINFASLAPRHGSRPFMGNWQDIGTSNMSGGAFSWGSLWSGIKNFGSTIKNYGSKAWNSSTGQMLRDKLKDPNFQQKVVDGLASGISGVVDLANQAVQNKINSKLDRKSTRLNSSHLVISYAVFCLKKKKGEITKTKGWSLSIVDTAASTKCTHSRMTSATDALACECARSDEEVVRDRVEGWTVSTRTTDGDDVWCAECSDASGLWSTNDVSSRDFPASDTAVPCARTTSRPYVAWNYGDTAEEELSEWTLSLEVKVHSELVQDVDVSNVG